MRENFDAALNFTLHFEGGFSNSNFDPGGATRFGVTHTTLSQYLRRPASVDDVKRLTVTTAKDIYLRMFWQPAGCDALPSGVDLILWDICVNAGLGRAHEFAAKTAALPPVARIEALHTLRMNFWKRLAIWARFGRGWTARETACRALALKLAGGGHA